MNCLQFPLGSFLKIHFPWSKPGGFIAASMLARHVWCGNFTVTLGIHTGSKQRVTQERILKFTWDLKRILFAEKRNVSLLFWVHTNKRRVFTDSKDVLGYFYLYDQEWRRCKSKWAHRSLSCANALPHKHFNSAHFSRLTSYWAAM